MTSAWLIGRGARTAVGVAKIENVACTVCGCVCDDLRMTLDQDQIVKAEGACRLAEPWFLAQGRTHPPVAVVAGQPTSLHDAVERAAALLRRARAPLVYGLSRSST